MIKILYVLNALGGGASGGIYEMIPHLPSDRYQAYAVAPAGGDESRARKLFTDVRIIPLPWWNIPDVDVVRRAAMRISERRHGITPERSIAAIKAVIREWGIDLVHTGTALNNTGALAARAFNIPHIWHIKESVGKANRVHFPVRDDAAMVKTFSDLSHTVIAMSDYIAEVFQAHDCPNITVIPDGVNLALYQKGESRDLRARLGIPHESDTVLIGMVAGLNSTWKQHDLFIESAALAAQSDPRLKFVIVGGGAPKHARFPYDSVKRYADSIIVLAKARFPDARLTILDFVPNPPDIMRSLDILVHPCDNEPFGRIAIEAMAAGTPVIGANAGGIAETITDDHTGLLVPPRDARAFADAMLRLANDPVLRFRLGANGRTRVKNGGYSIENHVRQLELLYQTATNSIWNMP